MPVSHNTNVSYAVDKMLELRPETTLDIGAGAGKYGHLSRVVDPYTKVDALEVWEPYIKEFNLKSLYDKVIKVDVREYNDFNYDLVIMGDILEHMEKEDAINLWNKVAVQAKAAILSIPICHMPQGHVHGNPYEEHIKDDWSHEEVMESFPGIQDSILFEETATYFAKFV